MNEESEIEKKGGRTELLLLIVIFAAPVLGAWLVYNYTDIGRVNSSSYGDLIEPPVRSQSISLYSPDNRQIAGELHGKWGLMYILPETCTDDCREKIYMLQRLKSSLANNSGRLQLLMAISGPADEIENDNIPDDFTARGFLFLSLIDLYQSIQNQDLNLAPGDILIVDPAGNLMMRYNSDSEGSGILQDVKRLLRYSRIG